MITYLNDFIGTTYSQDPFGYTCCFLLIIWMIYLFIQIIYNILGIHK